MLGDMLELGPTGAELHREIVADVSKNQVDLLFGAGPLTKSLFDAVEPQNRAKWAATSADIRDVLLAEVRAGDIVMIKGSNGSRMGLLVKALKEQFAVTGKELAEQD